MLSPSDIIEIYTLAQIETKITELQAAYEDAMGPASYSLDDIQSKQSVKNKSLEEIGSALQVWIKAKNLLSGNSRTKFYSGNFTGSHD